MKLITKFVWIYLIVTVIVLSIGGYVSYFIIQDELNNELKWRFYGRIERVTYLLEHGKEFGRGKIGEDGHLVVMQLPYRAEPRVEIRDTLVWNEWLQQMEPNLKMVAYRNVNEDSYYISTYGTLIETNDIREAVIQILLWILGMQVIGAIGVGFIVSNRLFRPFRKTLARIKAFNIQSKEPIEAEKTNVKEFDDLNIFVEEMTRKAVGDYKNLKEFAENASHEIQTPLAIAKGKLELLTETNLSAEQYKYVEAGQRSIKQLSRLSESLALLTKIDNAEFSNTDEVNLTHLIKESTLSFAEFIKLNGLEVKTDLEEDVIINIHPVLADILWTNLFQNAIKHNVEKGSIHIKLTHEYLNVSNTGNMLEGDPHELFERFKKGDQNTSSIGLGLSIIKRIVDLNSFEISYHTVDDWHFIEIEFKNK